VGPRLHSGYTIVYNRDCLDSIVESTGHGRAPALLAHQYLPGGWIGVAMEYIPDAVPITLHKSISKHFELWKTDLQDLVTAFHNEGFVHGDLRDASGNDGHVKVIDFDWGGKDGEVSYPTPKLNRELLEGRPSGGLTRNVDGGVGDDCGKMMSFKKAGAFPPSP